MILRNIMIPPCSSALLKIQCFRRIPHLVHGFGTKAWTQQCFKSEPGFKGFQPVIMKQVHSDIIHCIENVPDKTLEGDAVITSSPRILLVVKTADCLPVLLADKDLKAVAAVHCGWRGTAKRILDKTVKALQDKYGCSPSSLLAAMGPCIRPECYEVGEDVREVFCREGLSLQVFKKHPARRNKFFLDLKEANRLQMEEAGIPAENISSAEPCTHCDPGFFSYRRNSREHGRMFNVIGMGTTASVRV